MSHGQSAAARVIIGAGSQPTTESNIMLYHDYYEGLQLAARNSQWDVIQEYLMRGDTDEARAIVWC